MIKDLYSLIRSFDGYYTQTLQDITDEQHQCFLDAWRDSKIIPFEHYCRCSVCNDVADFYEVEYNPNKGPVIKGLCKKCHE